MQLMSYLTFNGQCEEGFPVLAKVFGRKVEAMIPHEGIPEEQG